MKVLVTGHSGYIGSVLVPFFAQAGHDVTGLDSGLFGECWIDAEGELDRDATRPSREISKDIRDVTQSDFVGYDAVVHLAALSNDPLGDLDADLTHEINYAASLRVAELAKAAGVERFLFSSSCSTYGAAGDDFLDEEAEFNPVTPYGVEKVRLEQALRKLADDDFTPTYLRNATAYGYSPRLRLDLVLNNLVAWALTTGEVKLLSDGTAWRPIVHVEDIARAFLAVLEAPREVVHDQAFNVGRTEHNYRIREIADAVADVVPGTQVVIADGASADTRCYRVNCDKLAETVPGFDPQWDARSSAERVYRALSSSGFDRATFDGPLYVRLRWLQERMGDGTIDQRLRVTQAAA